MAKNRAVVKNPKRLAQLVLLILGTLVLAAATGVNAIENAARAGNPAATLRTSPADAGALAAQADALLLSPDGKLDYARAAQLSRASLKSQAIEPRALRMLAFALDKAPTQTQTVALINLSTRVSRRDLWARIWLNEKSAMDGNVRAALSHYDIALRTNPSGGGQILFPTLAAALSEAEVQHALAPYIKKDAPWVLNLLEYWTSSQKDARPLANTIIKAGGLPRHPKFASQTNGIMRLLENGAAYTELRQVHATIEGADPKSLVTAELTQANTDPRFAGVSWTFPENPKLRASAAIVNGRYRMTVIATPSARSVAARKLLYLPPGNYNFSSMTRFVTRSPTSTAQWVLKCGGSGSLAPAMTLNLNPGVNPQVTATASVRAGCAPQYLDLFVQTGGGMGDTELQVDAITIRPASG